MNSFVIGLHSVLDLFADNYDDLFIFYLSINYLFIYLFFNRIIQEAIKWFTRGCGQMSCSSLLTTEEPMVNSRFRIFFFFRISKLNFEFENCVEVFLRGFLTIAQKKGEKIDSSVDAH